MRISGHRGDRGVPERATNTGDDFPRTCAHCFLTGLSTLLSRIWIDRAASYHPPLMRTLAIGRPYRGSFSQADCDTPSHQPYGDSDSTSDRRRPDFEKRNLWQQPHMRTEQRSRRPYRGSDTQALRHKSENLTSYFSCQSLFDLCVFDGMLPVPGSSFDLATIPSLCTFSWYRFRRPLNMPGESSSYLGSFFGLTTITLSWCHSYLLLQALGKASCIQASSIHQKDISSHRMSKYGPLDSSSSVWNS